MTTLQACADSHAPHELFGDLFGKLNSFTSTLQSLTTEDPYKRVQSLLDENAKLKRQIQRLETANDECIRISVRNSNNLQDANKQAEKMNTEMKQLKTEKVEAQTQLHVANLQLEENTKDMTKVKNELKQREARIEDLRKSLESEKERVKATEIANQKTTKDLKDSREALHVKDKDIQRKHNELGKLDRLAAKLVSLSRQSVVRRLDSIFASAYSLSKDFFAQDFEESLSGALIAAVKDLEQHDLVKNRIPVPATNSSAAKQMRATAAMAVIASSLTSIIFQPTYLLGKESELFRSMTVMASQDPEREAFLRRVFLAVTLAQPPKQKEELARALTGQVVKTVLRYVKKLIPTARQSEFESTLEDICRRALECWTDVQRWHERVAVTFDHHETEWKPILLPFSEAANGPQNGQRDANSTNGWMNPLDIGAAVWPGFLLLRPEGETHAILMEGYALNLVQIRGAKDEGTRRAARQNSRRQNSSRASTYIHGTDVDSAKSFLSSGDGGGSKENCVDVR